MVCPNWEKTVMTDEQLRGLQDEGLVYPEDAIILQRNTAQAQDAKTREAVLKEVGEWLKGKCVKTHCLGNIPISYTFEIDVLSMHTLRGGKMPEETSL